MKWRALAIILTLASGVAVYAGFYMGVKSLLWTRDSIYRELHFADLEVRFLPDDARNLPDLSRLEGVTRLERRLVFPGIVRPPGKTPITVIMTSLEAPTPGIHSFKFLAGGPFRADELDAVVIDASLATYHGYKVGDTLDVKVGEAVYHRRVVGIAITPEYFVSTSNPTYFIPEKGSLGFVFGNLEAMSDALGFTLINDLVFLFDPGADPALVKQRALARLRKLNIEQVSPRDRHFSYQFVQMQLDSTRVFIPALVTVLMALTFIVVSINVSRMIASERREIGGLMALGYGPRRLLGGYLELSLALGLMGGLLGLVLSLWVRDDFVRASARAMGMPEVRMTTDAMIMLRAVAYEVAVALVATAIPVLRLLRLPAQQVIKESPRPSSFRSAPALRGLASLVQRLPTSYRYALRNLTRQRVRTAVTVMSIALALAVATAYRLSLISLNTTMSGWLEQDRWSLSVDFLYPVLLERTQELGAMPSVTQMEPYLSCYVQAQAGSRVADSNLVGIDPDARLINVLVAEGRTSRPGSEREVVLTRELARRLAVGVGDVFQVEAMGQTYPVRLVGLSWAAVAGLSIVTFPVAQDICQYPGKATGAYLEVGKGGSAGADVRPYDLEFVGKVLAKRDLLTQVRTLLSGTIVLLDLATMASLFVGTLVILTSINLSVLENERDFGTLQALGYSRWQIASAVLTEAGVYAVGAVALGIPIAALISVYLNEQMSAAWIQVKNAFPPGAFARVLVPALFLIPLGCYPGIRHVVGRAALASIRSRVLD
jgi:ABC-type lipoprotein release transport system permease subunit